ncbi:MAG: CbtA family protein [Gammaproteobacteria bacterium]
MSLTRRMLSAAVVSGSAVGLFISALHAVTTTPLILHAEEYESADAAHHALPAMLEQASLHRWAAPGVASAWRFVPAHSEATGGAHDTQDGSPEGQTWAPEDGFERMLYTALANVITGIGYAFLLVACYALWGGRVDGRTGVLWGVGGFACFALAPALGLPPEVPSAMTAELYARQGWWLLTAVVTVGALSLLVFGKRRSMHLGGLVLLAVPHVVGAPQPAELGGSVPPEIAGHFAAASIVVSAVFWAALGWCSGECYRRFERV